jgi:glycosyltransferase involved in cell wall biosynthesis
MRIGLDAKRAFYNNRGLGNYSRNLIDAMVRTESDNSYFLFTPKIENRIFLSPVAEKSTVIVTPEKFFHRVAGSLWRSKFIIGDLKDKRIDLYHGLSHELPFGTSGTGIKTVVTVHDLIFYRYPEYYGQVNVYIYKKKLEYACRIADKIVAISTQTRDDLIHFVKADPGKIEVIPQSCNPCFHTKITKDDFQRVKIKYDLPDNYLLYVGAIEERKNLLGILEAMKKKGIRLPLVAIGNKTAYFHKIIRPFIINNGMDNIIFPEGINNDELPAVYQNALCFVYPSFYEGFGIPILEALTSGTPVITSKGSCFEETGGPGSVYIDPYKPDEIGDAILRISEDKEFRSEIINKGVRHAELFSPQNIARKYLDLYQSIIQR